MINLDTIFEMRSFTRSKHRKSAQTLENGVGGLG